MKTSSLGAGLLRFRNGIVEAEELLDAGDAHRMADTFIDPNQSKRVSVLVMADIGSNQGPDSRRINVRDAGEVNNQGPVFAGLQGRLKMKKGTQHHRTLEAKDAVAGLVAVEIFDMERFL